MRPLALPLLLAAALLALPSTAAAAKKRTEPGHGASPVAGPCDPIDPSQCMYPFPNDFYTRPDRSTVTKRRVDLPLRAMPVNRWSKPIDPTDWNRADGFSPGSLIVTKVPGLDNEKAFAETGAVPQTDIERSYDRDAPVVLIDAATGERQLIWSELDAQAASDADRTLMIRPAKNLLEGHRYIVALRHLRDEHGKRIEPNADFKSLIEGAPTAAVAGRRAHLESLFATLADAGIKRKELYLAWDFTVASRQSLTGRMVAIRDEAFAELGDTNLADLQVAGSSPTFKITSSRDAATGDIMRTVRGTMTVPCFMNVPGCPPGLNRFALDPAADATAAGYPKPMRIPGNTMAVDFECRIPRKAAAAPSRPSLYGHGLFGGFGEVEAGNVSNMAQEHNFTFCATDWAGMATYDIPNVASILLDLSNFPTLADRVQQGMLNFLFLGRAMIHPQGLISDPAFQVGGRPVLDTTRLFYDGNSQGGIIGGALAAVAPDYERAVLGVPGMNYSTLLTRSVDFGTGKSFPPDPTKPDELGVPEYAGPLYYAYPDHLERPLLFGLIQMLWDRAEANGYAQHMTSDPLPNTPEHAVMLHVAFGDHQVAPVSAEVEARTIGARVLRKPGMLFPGRHSDVDPFFAIEAFDAFPAEGSALVVWDSGSPTPPAANVPPMAGADPHSHPRADPKARAMKSAFLSLDGKVVDTCAGAPCTARGYAGPVASRKTKAKRRRR